MGEAVPIEISESDPNVQFALALGKRIILFRVVWLRGPRSLGATSVAINMGLIEVFDVCSYLLLPGWTK